MNFYFRSIFFCINLNKLSLWTNHHGFPSISHLVLGGSVNVTASRNTGFSVRSGSLTIKTASGLTKLVLLSQKANTQSKYYIEIAGDLYIKNEDPNTTLNRIDIYFGFYNSEGDIIGPYEGGVALDIVTGATERASLEFYKSFNYQPDQQPFDLFGWIQLKQGNNTNIRGRIDGDIEISTFYGDIYIPGGTEFDQGKLEPSRKIGIDVNNDDIVRINNNSSEPIVIEDFH